MSKMTFRPSGQSLAGGAVTVFQPIAIAENNQQLIGLWLHGKSHHTQRSYKQDIEYFLSFQQARHGEDFFVGYTTVNDLQDYTDSCRNKGWKNRTINRRLAAIKSLLTFGCACQLLRVNAGAAVKLKKPKHDIAERILTESEMLTLIALEPNRRNQIMIRFLYAVGCRVEELSNLRWRDFQTGSDGTGIVTIFGKGEKTRHVVFSRDTWQLVRSLRGNASANDFVFRSQCKKQSRDNLKPNRIRQIIQKAGERIGIPNVSPHWFRHSHASHSVDRQTPLPLIQQTLGHASLETTGMYLHVRPKDSSALHLSV
jgi:integrase/recombinase XerD